MFSFTEQEWDPVKIEEETPHKDYFKTVVKDSWLPGIESQWSVWLIWDSIQAFYSLIMQVWYFAIAFYYVGIVEDIWADSGEVANFELATYILNGVYLIASFVKIIAILLTNETFFDIDENGLRVLNEIRMYIWNPTQRFEIGIEAYAEILKVVIVAANFAVIS